MGRSARPEAPRWWGFSQALLVCSFLVIASLGILRSDRQLENSDWPSFMVAGRLAATAPGLLYDRGAELREQRIVVGAGSYDLPGYGGLLPVVAPPWVALYAAPFAALGLGSGGRLWVLVQVLSLLGGLVLVTGARELVRAAAALAGVPLLLLVGNAQLDGLVVLGLGLAWRLHSKGRPLWAGLALGLTLVKPHLVLGVAAGLIAVRCWQTLLGWLLAGLAVLGVSLALAPGSLAGWPAAALATAGHNGNDLSLPGLLYSLGVAPPLALLVGALLALAVTLQAARRARSREAAAAILVLGGLLAAPHLLATDLVLACFALVLAGLAAVGPLLALSLCSLALGVRIPPAVAAWGGCLFLCGLVAAVSALADRPWAPGIIGREFGSR